ncbi:MAG: hypothetical protein AAFO91_09165 [Bacteroidota bacterium]
MEPSLTNELEFYKSNQEQLVADYRGRFLVIKDAEVKGDYSTEFEALTEAQKEFELGSFLIQEAAPGEDSYTETLHRVFVA